MRAVQGLEDSARSCIRRSAAAILYGRLANCSASFFSRIVDIPNIQRAVCIYAFSLLYCTRRNLFVWSNSTL
jgi:hypothetical protein